MAASALATFITRITSIWGPLTTELVAGCRQHLEALTQARAAEEWLAALHRDATAYKELHRDPTHGFELLAHTEHAGLYRAPHDHGRGWVIYAIQRGEIEMGTYGRSEGPDGRVQLVKRDATLLRPGQAMVYLPGDIHDTLCVTGPALLLRFSERDLRKEDKEEHRVTRYVERDGRWTVGTP